MLRSVLLLVIGLALASSVWAVDPWPQWRGPNRDGISPEKGLLNEWKDAPPLIWKAQGLGNGFAAAVVDGGIVCTMGSRRGHGKTTVIALSDKDGKEIWMMDIDDGGGDAGSMCTPTMDGERVYAVSGKGKLVCLKLATGERIWERDFKKDYEGETQQFGYAESPLVDGDKLICSPGGPKAGIVALDKKTGKELWRCALAFDGKMGVGASYSSVVISNGAKIKQYVQLMKQGLVGIDARTGKQLWSYSRLNAINSPCTPIVRDDYVFAPCGWYVGSALLKLTPAGNGGVAAKEVYLLEPRKLSTNSGGAVLVGDYVYGSHVQGGAPQCIEFLTGKLVWEKERGPGSGPAAVMYADGNLYFQYENGVMALVAASPDKYELKGQFQAPNKKRSLAHPAISNGRLYMRMHDTLYCYDLKKK
ncbi:MAG: PQQ-like beta-propeller repeat protein [Planctomycetia bacterium]|nr:PQQ-like beta-propeller repeat protein [Planctomycetia bacterium]